jgi:putative membrane protein
MTVEITLAYLHFVALIGTASLLVAETVLCRPGIRGDTLHRLKFVDIGYFGFAIATLATGALRLFWGTKGSAFYLGNPIFYVKLALFVVVGLLSILPTVRFIQWSKQARKRDDFVPERTAVAGVGTFLRFELIVLAAIPLLATLMARGVSV